MSTKYVYFFGGKSADGDGKMKNLLGGKGANLGEMCKIGLPVPAGFTLTTEVCNLFTENNNEYPNGLKEEVETAIAKCEEVMGAKFGDAENPLLMSCRSGARVSMPGMMDTVLNIGLNEKTLAGLAKKSGNERFAWDSYRRFVQMYGDVVLGMKPESKQDDDPFEQLLHDMKHKRGVKQDNDLTVDDLKELVKQFKSAVKKQTGKDFPDDARDQLWGAIGAVFGSWMNDRAISYRRQYGIPANWGTAANIQSMVFGNMSDDSGTGVAFTRDPASGEKEYYGEYLTNAQGEDVVAGIRTPKKIVEMEKELPQVYKQLCDTFDTLEKHYRDMQDIEFTIQQNKLWMLQTRNGKRTGFAAVRIAVDMVEEGLIKKEEAISVGRIPPDDVNQLLQPLFDPEAKRKAIEGGQLLTTGIKAGPGAATGKIKFFADDAVEFNSQYKADDEEGKVVLVRRETSPEDLDGMRVATGILTAFGGATSHAAVVSRQMGKVCVVGCGELEIDYKARTVGVGSNTLKEGDWISIDGFTGEVIAGKVPTRPSEVAQVLFEGTMKPEESHVYQQFEKLMSWADETRKLAVRTNADSPNDAAKAVKLGAEGIGLCRTEHMFFGDERIQAMREMILATTEEKRKAAIAKLLPYQRDDFAGLFKAMDGKPVTIRTLDPPLHEFLSERHFEEDPALAGKLAKSTGVSEDAIHNRVASLHEQNPMLGFRGCRLGIVYPEIIAMQARAIFEAACDVQKSGTKVMPEVMIPLVGFVTELKDQAKYVHEVAAAVFKEKGVEVEYLCGTMIELPRACMVADQIAKEAQFFSFGTNDLTQTALGVSRDDYGPFIRHYTDNDVVPRDPFQTIDFDGVGALMKLGVEKGQEGRPGIKLGICGEHGGDPDSVKFCHKIGLDYVSCSPLRVPIARLAAAQAALEK